MLQPLLRYDLFEYVLSLIMLLQEYVWKATYKVEAHIEELQQRLQDLLEDPSLSFNSPNGLKMNVEVKGDTQGLAMQYYKSDSFRHSKTVVVLKNDELTREFCVSAGSSLAFYQLVFVSLGLVVESDVIYCVQCREFPPAIPNVLIEVQPRTTFNGSSEGLAEGVYSILSMHGTYLTAQPGGEGSSVKLQASASRWILSKAPWGCYGLRSPYGTYLRAHPGGEGSTVDVRVPRLIRENGTSTRSTESPIDTRSWRANNWEQFVLVDAPDGRFGLRTVHGTYIRAHPNFKVDTQTDKFGWEKMRWEQFTFQKLE